VAPVIGSVRQGSIAEAAGLEPRQEIVSVDGKRTTTQQQVEMRLAARLGETGEIHLGVRYPDSDIVYESSAQVSDWMQDAADPNLTEAFGIEYRAPEAIIGEVTPGSAAERAGILAGDRVLAIDGQPIEGWLQWAERLRASPELRLAVQIQRGTETLTLDLVPARILEDGKEIGRAGVGPAFLRTERYGVLDAWRPAVSETWSLTVFTLDSVGKLLTGRISTKNLSGPITIAKVAGATAKLGLKYYVTFIAMLSIMLGVLNLLPIPVLDGGHLLFFLIEMVKGSPVSERVQMLGYQVGFAILVGVMILALFNDISRIAAN
jgi:regulator of sigma E protease